MIRQIRIYEGGNLLEMGGRFVAGYPG